MQTFSVPPQKVRHGARASVGCIADHGSARVEAGENQALVDQIELGNAVQTRASR